MVSFDVSARKRRAENRSVTAIHEDLSTALTKQSRKRGRFRGSAKGSADKSIDLEDGQEYGKYDQQHHGGHDDDQ